MISLEVSGAANDRYHPEARAACADAYDAPRYSECLRHWEADCDQRQRERPCFNVGGRPELQARWPPHLPCTSAAQAIPRMKPLHNNEVYYIKGETAKRKKASGEKKTSGDLRAPPFDHRHCHTELHTAARVKVRAGRAVPVPAPVERAAHHGLRVDDHQVKSAVAEAQPTHALIGQRREEARVRRPARDSTVAAKALGRRRRWRRRQWRRRRRR